MAAAPATPFGLLNLATIVARCRLHTLRDAIEEQLRVGRRSHGADTAATTPGLASMMSATTATSSRGRRQLQDTSDGRERQWGAAWLGGSEALKPVGGVPVGVRLRKARDVEIATAQSINISALPQRYVSRARSRQSIDMVGMLSATED
jgi:hypothetical protein